MISPRMKLWLWVTEYKGIWRLFLKLSFRQGESFEKEKIFKFRKKVMEMKTKREESDGCKKKNWRTDGWPRHWKQSQK